MKKNELALSALLSSINYRFFKKGDSIEVK